MFSNFKGKLLENIIAEGTTSRSLSRLKNKYLQACLGAEDAEMLVCLDSLHPEEEP